MSHKESDENYDMGEVVYAEYDNKIVQHHTTADGILTMKKQRVSIASSPLFRLEDTKVSEGVPDWNKLFRMDSQYSQENVINPLPLDDDYPIEETKRTVTIERQLSIESRSSLTRKRPINDSVSKSVTKFISSDPGIQPNHTHNHTPHDTLSHLSLPTFLTPQLSKSQSHSHSQSTSKPILSRPAHWGRSEIKLKRPSSRTTPNSASKATQGRPSQSQGYRRLSLQPLPTVSEITSLDEVKFRPSWMSSTQVTLQPSTNNDVDDIQEVEMSTSPIPVRRLQREQSSRSSSLAMSSNFNPSTPPSEREVTPSRQLGSFASPGENYASPFNHTRKLAKPKPGSLRAKLQRLRRCTEADRIFMMSRHDGSVSNITDLSDPRNRATYFVDVEIHSCDCSLPNYSVVTGIVKDILIRSNLIKRSREKDDTNYLVDILEESQEEYGHDVTSVVIDAPPVSECFQNITNIIQTSTEVKLFMLAASLGNAFEHSSSSSLVQGQVWRIFDPYLLSRLTHSPTLFSFGICQLISADNS